MENLTKENFWDQLMEKYPEEMKRFCTWIDEYKKRVEWNGLFCSQYTDGEKLLVPKYHQIPIAMQFGIFLQFAKESWSNEQIDGERAFREQSINFITSWFIRKDSINELSEPVKPKE